MGKKFKVTRERIRQIEAKSSSQDEAPPLEFVSCTVSSRLIKVRSTSPNRGPSATRSLMPRFFSALGKGQKSCLGALLRPYLLNYEYFITHSRLPWKRGRRNDSDFSYRSSSSEPRRFPSCFAHLAKGSTSSAKPKTNGSRHQRSQSQEPLEDHDFFESEHKSDQKDSEESVPQEAGKASRQLSFNCGSSSRQNGLEPQRGQPMDNLRPLVALEFHSYRSKYFLCPNSSSSS